MASKRKRPAAPMHPDGNSPDVTDYFGSLPSSSNKKKQGTRATETSSLRAPSPQMMTRRARAAAQAQAASESASTRRRTRTQRDSDAEAHVEEDDEPVNVDFIQVSSASNAARFGNQRTVNGLQLRSNRIVQNNAAMLQGNQTGETVQEDEYEDEDDGEEGMEDDQEAEELERPQRPTKRLRSSNQTGPSNQRTRPNTRSQNKMAIAFREVYKIPDETSPQPASKSRRRTATARRSNEGVATGSRGARRPQQSTRRSVVLRQEDLSDDGSSSPGEEDEDGDLVIEGNTIEACDDSAFIEAPGPGEELGGIEVVVNSFGGIDETLSHVAWTGEGSWKSTVLDRRCKSPVGGRLHKCLNGVYSLLIQAVDARDDVDDVEGAYKRTIDILRDNSEDLRGHLAAVTGSVDAICTEHLAHGPDLDRDALQARNRLLRDLARRILPVLVLIIEKTCELKPTFNRRGKIHLMVDAFTLQFVLRTVGWAKRLERALIRGLDHWPIDTELAKEEDQLDENEAKLQQAKIDARKRFNKQLTSLASVARRAAWIIEEQAKEATRQERENELRRRSVFRQRAIKASMEREEQAQNRKHAERFEAWVRSTQAQTQMFSDPLKEKWDRAKAAQREIMNSETSQPGPFSNHYDDDDPFIDVPSSRTLNNDLARTGHAYHQTYREPYGSWNKSQEWTREEEKVLVNWIRYSKDYNMEDLAKRLGRREGEVRGKVSVLKALYRDIYRKRGSEVPVWAL